MLVCNHTNVVHVPVEQLYKDCRKSTGNQKVQETSFETGMHVSGYAHVPFVYYIHVHEQWRKGGRRERGREEGGCLLGMSVYMCVH